MARRRFRRYRRRTGRWASNLQEINSTTVVAPANSTFFNEYTLAFNPTQLNTSVSQTFTVKHLEVSFYIDEQVGSGADYIEDVAAYVMFVPQGMTVTADYNLQHPEYIMAYKFLGSPSAGSDQQYQPYKIRTRLSRKLQSGDHVILFIKGNNINNTVNINFMFHGLVRWWTKAN